MRLDIVAHPLQPLRRETMAGRQRETPDEMPSDADAHGSAEGFDQDPFREATFDLLGQSRDDLAQQRVLQRNVQLEPGCCLSKLRQQGGIQIFIPDRLNVTRLGLNGPDRKAGWTKRERARRGKGRFPGGSLLDLQEHRRALIPGENQPVAVTSPDGFTAIPVVAHRGD
jgi:hypothetical protein